MKRRSETEKLEDEIEHTVGRLVEAYRAFLLLLVRLSRERWEPGEPR